MYNNKNIRQYLSIPKWVSIIKIAMILCIFFFTSSCNIFGGKEKKSNENNPERDISEIPIHYKSPNSSYQRDSMFIVATVWEFIKKQVSPYHYYTVFNVPFNKITIDVDSIMYSPDSLKLFAFVIITDPDVQHGKYDKYVFSGNSIVGYRLSKKTPWTIYDFDQYSVAGFKKYNSVRNLFRHYYFGNGDFRNDAEYIWDSTTQDRVSVKFGYNLDQLKFWDSSLVWKKGARIPGFYNFQTKGNVTPQDEDPIIHLPKLNYPDSLLDMYK
jgi:hypothetical protein